MKHTDKHCRNPILILLVMTSFFAHGANRDDDWRFVSIPDFLNADTTYPQPGWEETLSYVLQSIKQEDPEFVVVPGDLVQGRWKSKAKIDKYADLYYEAWKARMEAHNLPYYVSIGDHEIGDNPWLRPKKVSLVPHFKAKFREHMQMPLNGPETNKGATYWFRKRNVLFVSLDVFEKGFGPSGRIVADVSQPQLTWLADVVKENRKHVDHVIVMGHTPIIKRVRKEHSSGMHLKGGRDSALWQTLVNLDVDLYLCGEVHAITCVERDGILQVSHGSIFGINDAVNYLTVRVLSHRLELSIKELPVENSGGKLWQPGSKQWVPHAKISIPEQARYLGFQTIQAAIIDKHLDPTWITIYNTEYAGTVGIAFSGVSLIAAIVSIVGFWRWYKRKKKQRYQEDTDEVFANDQLAYDAS